VGAEGLNRAVRGQTKKGRAATNTTEGKKMTGKTSSRTEQRMSGRRHRLKKNRGRPQTGQRVAGDLDTNPI